jgi:hypothetical protein
MKVNYNRLSELNREALTSENREMASFYIIQQGVERFLINDDLTEDYKNFLLEMGVLELTEEERVSQTIVGPFKFNNNGIKETH